LQRPAPVHYFFVIRGIGAYGILITRRELSCQPPIHSSMKRLLLLVAALASACVDCAAGAAQFDRAEYVARLQTCEAILQNTMLNQDRAIPPIILKRAKGIVIVNQLQVSMVLGVKDGWGVALVKEPNGKWSVPVFLKASEFSLGLQAGGKTIETIFVLMDDPSTRLLFSPRFEFGIDAKVVAGPLAAEAERATETFTAQVLVYSNVKGVYAGATVKTGAISPIVDATQQFYETKYGIPEILFSDWVKPQTESLPLINYLQKLTP
jgi:lipid-binding SYLF domain-containing protein